MSVKLSKQMWKRALTVVLAMIILGFGADLASLVRIQLIQSEKYQQKAQSQQLSDKKINALRGTIYDASGNVLAKSATVWTIYLVPNKIKTDDNGAQKQKVVDGLAEILSMKKEDIVDKIGKGKSSYVELKRKVENPEKEKIVKLIDDESLNQVIGMTQSTKRYYPNSNFASTVIGFTGTDDQGLAGIESYYDKYLTGVPGRVITAKNALQDAMPNQFETTVDAQNGNSLVLTIDEVIQHYLEKNIEQALEDTNALHGYGIVMDVKTGAILGMTTKPDYDPNNPWSIADEKTKAEIAKITDTEEKKKAESAAVYSQWRNRTLTDTYEPGSVFKTFTASAALEEGTVTENSTFFCRGSVKVGSNIIHCYNRSGHGAENFVQGMENSCNPVFIEVAQRLGGEKFYKYLESFGMTSITGIDLPGEAAPIAHKKDKFGIAELSSTSFGQTWLVTPIQMATGLTAIANGGKLMQPYVVGKILDADGNVVSTTQPTVKRQVISESTSKRVLQLMRNVVDVGGGKNAYVAGYRVAGKTGTSEKVGNRNADGSKKYVASFGGIAPSDDPRIVVLIILDEPKGLTGGGAVAAPVAARVIEETLKHLNVEPKYTEEELAKLNLKAPKVTGMTVAAAKNELDKQSFKSRVVGNGTKVVKQVPSSGQGIPSGGTVVLYTEESSEQKTTAVPDFTKQLTVTQVNALAAEYGLNIRLSGIDLNSSGVESFKQSETVGAKVAIGSTITVYFRHTTGVEDSAD